MADAAVPAPAKKPAQKQTALEVEVVKQFPGQLQVDRRVKVNVLGKFVERYNKKHHASLHTMLARHAEAAASEPQAEVSPAPWTEASCEMI